MTEPEFGDELRNPQLNDPESMRDVAARVDDAQGFEILEPLPGEEEADDGYESEFPEQESEADAKVLDRMDVEAGLARPYTSATESQSETDIAREITESE